MGVAESVYYLFQEFQGCLSVTLANRLCFHPLGEFINCHKEVGVLVGGSFERSHHIKYPYCKGQGDRNHPEFLSRHVILLCITLTSITLLDDILCIRILYFVEDGSSLFR